MPQSHPTSQFKTNKTQGFPKSRNLVKEKKNIYQLPFIILRVKVMDSFLLNSKNSNRQSVTKMSVRVYKDLPASVMYSVSISYIYVSVNNRSSISSRKTNYAPKNYLGGFSDSKGLSYDQTTP